MANENYKNKIDVLRRACSSYEQKTAFWKGVEANLNNKIDEHILENKAFEREFDCEIQTSFASYPIILKCNFQFNPSESDRWITKITIIKCDPIFDEPLFTKNDDEDNDDYDNLTIWSKIASFSHVKRMLLTDGGFLNEIEEFLKKDEILNSKIVIEEVRKANAQIKIIKKGGDNTGQIWFTLGQLITQIEGKTQKIYMGKTIIEYIKKAVKNEPINQKRVVKATEANLKKTDRKREVIEAAIIHAYSYTNTYKNRNDLAKQLQDDFSDLCERDSHLRQKLRKIFTLREIKNNFIIPISTLTDYIPEFGTKEFEQLVTKAQKIDFETAKKTLIKLLKLNK